MKNLKNFKFLVIGLGSMGKRRIRNLLFHGIKKENIFGFDIRVDRNREAEEKFGIKTAKTFRNAVSKFGPDVYIVSTPPDKHYLYMNNAVKNKKHIFVEHPVTDWGYKNIIRAKNFVKAPSCTLRFHPAVKLIKNIIDTGTIGKTFSFQYHLGQYLPSWHPWEDYRKVYFSKKFTGACREMFGFELVWLDFALSLGKVSKVVGFTEKLSDLDMTADDRYSALLKFKKGVSGSIIIDLISRKPFRTLRVIGSEGVLEWEWQENLIKVFDVNTGKEKIIKLKKGKSLKNYVTTEDMYEEEFKHLLKAIAGETSYPYSFEESLEHLQTLFALEKNAKKNN